MKQQARSWIILLIVFTVAACGVNGPVSPKKFTFYKENKLRHIKLKVPSGFKDELVRIGTYGKEQYYTYPDGSIFFVGLNMDWPSFNQERKLTPYSDSLESRSGSYKGIDTSGLHWKEIHFDYFIVGYSFVSPAKRELFDQAVNTISFKGIK